MDDILRAALESYDADGYELVLLTPDSYAVIRNMHETLVLGPAGRPTTMPALHPRDQRLLLLPPRRALLAVALLIAAVLVGTVLARVRWLPEPGVPTASTTPTASPTAPPSSASPAGPVPPVLSGALPTDERVRMFVFTGGTMAELVAVTRCETGMPVYWATTDDGQFIAYSPRDQPYNPLWHREFPEGTRPATALIGTCR